MRPLTTDERIRGQIRAYMAIRHKTATEICSEIGKSRSWWSRKMEEPTQIPVADLSRIYRRLQIPKGDRIYDLDD